MSNYYLEHYGVAGMRWGRRRASLGAPVVELGSDEYRDAGSSGSRRSSSRRDSSRRNTDSSNSSNNGNNSSSSNRNNNANNSSSTNTRNNSNNRTTNETTNNANDNSNKFDVKGAKTSLKEGKKLADAGVKYLENDRTKETARNLKSEAKNMTDDDLRQVISRLSMEEKYVAAMTKEGAGKSKTDLQKTLELVGTAVSYADTALDVYDKIQSIRGR